MGQVMYNQSSELAQGHVRLPHIVAQVRAESKASGASSAQVRSVGWSFDIL